MPHVNTSHGVSKAQPPSNHKATTKQPPKPSNHKRPPTFVLLVEFATNRDLWQICHQSAFLANLPHIAILGKFAPIH
jgi:hypothetical protein